MPGNKVPVKGDKDGTALAAHVMMEDTSMLVHD